MYGISPVQLGALVGLSIHRGLFIHGEWHVQAPYIFSFHLVGFGMMAMMKSGWQVIAGYIFTLFASIFIYRVFSHRLKHFPGPFWACVTKLWHIWKARNSQNHFLLRDIQKQYGDFVRTGPSEITVFHPDVFIAIDGALSKCCKAEWYDLLHPNKSLVTARIREVHRERRSQWSQGFSSKTLPHYKRQILSLIDELDNCIQADITAGQISEVSDFFHWLAFDRMGKFVLGKSFNMLTHQHWHHVILRLQKALSLLGPLSPVPWLVQIAFRLMPPIWLLKDWAAMVGWCESELKQIQMPVDASSQAPALANYLKQDYSCGKSYEEWLVGDSILAIVAGSGPTAGVILGLFYELAKNPVHAEIINEEIVNQAVDVRDSQDLARRCPHLEAAIIEAMRLYPSLPTGGNRKTPSHEGITVNGVFIPPDTTVVAPRFVIARREDCFTNANDFVPERWTTRPEMVHNRAAMAPFGIGHRTCLGKPLAMSDMLLVTAHIVRKYRFKFPPGESGDMVFNSWTDQFTTYLGPLRLIFEERQR